MVTSNLEECITCIFLNNLWDAVASCLVRSTPDQVVLAAQCFVFLACVRHFTLTVPLSIHVYKWLLVNLMLGGNPAMD